MESQFEFSSCLPQQMTSFIGRGRDLALVKGLFRDGARLVTLTGAGGCGKSRLALRVASDLETTYTDGACWVELAPLSDSFLVPQAVAAWLKMQTGSGSSPEEQLVGYLRPRRLLLILDNCEHLLTACADLAGELLRSCPALVILATSREALGVPGEIAYVVPSLSLPEMPVATLPELQELRELAQVEAVSLFIERAQMISPGFALTAQNVAAVIEICRRLDGIPLALELAAARTRLMRTDEIAQHLDGGLLLSGRGRNTPPRHQTMKAAID